MANDLEKWSSWSEEDAKQQASNDKPLKLEEGTTRLRFAPGYAGKRPYAEVWQHWVPGPTPGVNVPVPCSGKGCPLCSYANGLKASQSAADQTAGKEMGSRSSRIWPVVVRGKEDLGWQMFAVPYGVFQTLSTLRQDPENGGDFTAPGSKGFDVLITRKGKGLTTKYPTVGLARTPSPLLPTQQETLDLLNKLPDVSALEVKATHGEVQAKMVELGLAEAGSQAASKALPPGKGSSKATKPGRTAADDLAGDDMTDAPAEDNEIPF